MSADPIPLASSGPFDAVDLGLGRLVCTRAPSRVAMWIVAVLVVALGLVLVVTAVALVVARRPEWQVAVALLVAGVLMTVIGVWTARYGMTSTRFFEQGAVRFYRTTPKVVIPYVEALTLTHALVTQRYHGVPIGTSISMTITAVNNRLVRYSGTHQTKYKRKSLFGEKEVVKVDELDVVRDHVAAVIADQLADMILSGQSVEWCKKAVLTDQGLTPKGGRYKSQLIPYELIDRQAFGEGDFSLFKTGDEKAFVTLPLGGANFWPCLALMHRMVVAAQGEGAAEEQMGMIEDESEM